MMHPFRTISTALISVTTAMSRHAFPQPVPSLVIAAGSEADLYVRVGPGNIEVAVPTAATEAAPNWRAGLLFVQRGTTQVFSVPPSATHFAVIGTGTVIAHVSIGDGR